MPKIDKFVRRPTSIPHPDTDLKFESNYGGYNGVFCCQHCDGAYLHQCELRVHAREKEDAPNGSVYTITSGGREDMPSDMYAGNTKIDITHDELLYSCPSARRSGTNIYFWCENCSGITVLGISQHKGMTILEYISW